MDDVNIKYVGGNWYKGTYKNYEFEEFDIFPLSPPSEISFNIVGYSNTPASKINGFIKPFKTNCSMIPYNANTESMTNSLYPPAL